MALSAGAALSPAAAVAKDAVSLLPAPPALGSLSPRAAEEFRPTAPRQVAGCSLRTLHDAPLALRESAERVYVAAQTGGPVIEALGFAPEDIRAYAAFMVGTAARHPWNVVAVNPSGEAVGLFLVLHDLDSADASSLPPPAAAHWNGVFRAIAAEVNQRVAGAAKDCVTPIIGCAVPAYQGKGLYPAMAMMNADLCAEHGFSRFWSFTHNPYLVQAIGKTDGGTAIISRVASLFFKAPPSLSNNLLIPAAQVMGLLPEDRIAFFLDKAKVPALRACANNVLVAVSPLVTSEMAARRRARRAKL